MSPDDLNQEETDALSLLIDEYGDQLGYPWKESLRTAQEKLPDSESEQ